MHVNLLATHEMKMSQLKQKVAQTLDSRCEKQIQTFAWLATVLSAGLHGAGNSIRQGRAKLYVPPAAQ